MINKYEWITIQTNISIDINKWIYKAFLNTYIQYIFNCLSIYYYNIYCLESLASVIRG